MRRWAVALMALLLVGCSTPAPAPSVAVGATDDVESTLLAQLYAAALRYYGSAAHVETSSDPVADLDTGDVQVAPGLTGRLLTRFDPGSTARAAEQVYRSMVSALPEGVAAGDYAQSADDEPAVAVTERTAQAWGGRDVTALSRNCGDLVAGAVADVVTPRTVGPCTLAEPREFRDPAALFGALQAGRIDMAWTSTAASGLPDWAVVLTDRTALIRADNVVPLYRRNELSEQQVLALNQIAGELDTGSLADMLRQAREGKDPGALAADWLSSHPLGH
ncbi:glycine betaine ABC transporter substrate-binding protein [Mycolicibacterium sediminis]|uniref:ABC transporter substrate-binding protein n=2 Tax=Mycolicibacterium sediminis TaxID=1286180 RepID=A0A7I7QXX1_9MYCO|nr:glycine betaine ABC transporter substrate-binding protein [Mycolicibacterium sediminis]BBY31229.1 ABC transporter substrate-binding protein [Mycolicibacterium sediminis]